MCDLTQLDDANVCMNVNHFSDDSRPGSDPAKVKKGELLLFEHKYEKIKQNLKVLLNLKEKD